MRGSDEAVPAERDLLGSSEAGGLAIRGSAVRLVGYVVQILFGLVAVALLFRHLGVEDSGRYVTVLALIALVGGASDAGLTLVGVRELSARPDAASRDLVRTILGFRLALGLAGVAAATAFAAVAGYDSVVVAGTAVVGVAWMLQSYQLTLTVPLLRDLRLGAVTLMDLLRQVVSVVLIAALVAAGATLFPFFLALVPAALVALLVTAAIVRKTIPLGPSFVWDEWRRLLRDVLPFAAAVAVSSLYFRIAIVLMSLIATAEQTGYFGASFRVIEVLIVIPQLAISAAFPIFARAANVDTERFHYGVRRTFEVAVLFGGWLALALVLGAPLAIQVVGGAEFEPAVSVLRIQGVAMFASVITVVWGLALVSLRRHRELFVINAVGLVVSGVLTLVLASSHGARGAAVATTLGEAAIVVVGAVLLVRAAEGLRLPFGVLLRVAAAAAPALALALVPGLPTIVLVVLASAVYVGILLALRAIPPELLVELRRLRLRPAR